MSAVTMKQLLEAGVHFGHQTRRWNPKMKPYIYGERNGIHIIDLRQTLDQVDKAAEFVKDLSTDGGAVLFVGTKKQAQAPITEHAQRSANPYVTYRWLGGMLTNFTTIQKRIYYLKELRRMEDTQEIEALPKKERLRLRREREKLDMNLGGVVDMTRLPNALFVVDVNTETTAVSEAARLGIPVIALVDSNSNPEQVDFVIPGNDDAIRSADLIAGAIAEAAIQGREIAAKQRVIKAEGAEAKEGANA
ncbi:MAG TPA: 30S ribosomal protein S2 [Acidimicrobiia bacterium]|nr:30S ribosomal protein S2 [Acidimicrobiia bacterium]